MRKFFFYILLALFCANIFPVNLAAAESGEVKMTITPPLIKNNMDKGETWASNLKVVNNGTEPITVYTEVSDFKSREDGAGPEFIKKENVDEAQSHYLLSQWLDVQPGPLVIPAQQSIEIPFVINLPDTVEPGGHYAAILVGTKPTGSAVGTAIKTSSLLASLIMLEVKGDIKEGARITEFTTGKEIYQKPTANFLVKLKNEGNIHLQPQGEIKITSPWGAEKGKILINQGSEFGNILPNSSREWKFDWAGDSAFWEMGRYKADLTLSFGSEAKEAIGATLYFWVINFKLVSIVGGSILFIVLLITWLVRRSIRKAIQATAGMNNVEMSASRANDPAVNRVQMNNRTVSRQSAGAVDLRARNNNNRKRLD